MLLTAPNNAAAFRRSPLSTGVSASAALFMFTSCSALNNAGFEARAQPGYEARSAVFGAVEGQEHLV